MKVHAVPRCLVGWSLFVPLLLCACLAACNPTVDGGDNPDFASPADLAVSLDGGPDGMTRCATATSQIEQVPLYLHFVLDGSGSMRQNGKWSAAVPALGSVFTDFQGQKNPLIGVGLTVFGDHLDKTISDNFAGPYDKLDVPLSYVDEVQLAKLTARLIGTSPYLGTPTYEVLAGQFPLLQSFQPQTPLQPGGKRILVFITDGVPDTDMPAGQNEVPWSLDLTQRMSSQSSPIPTFIVGVGHFPPQMGEDYSPRFLGAMAVAGGTRQSSTCNPDESVDLAQVCYFQITPPPGAPSEKDIATLRDKLIAALVSIRKQAQACEFTLQRVNIGHGEVDPENVNVIYVAPDGTRSLVPQNGSAGWTYDNPQAPSRVILHGQSCTRLVDDPRGTLMVVLGCKTVLG